MKRCCRCIVRRLVTLRRIWSRSVSTAERGDALRPRRPETSKHIRNRLATARRGRIIREGVRVVIFGPTNAGKSSLLNRLLGYERAIVSEIHGTTRDTIEEVVNLGGV